MHAIEAMITCPICGYLCEMEEYIINCGWCDRCFNASWERYMEESAGPFDWIVKESYV